MPEKENITNPSMGSNKVGEETTKKRGKGVSAGTDTQTQMAAISAEEKEKEEKKEKKEKQQPDPKYPAGKNPRK